MLTGINLFPRNTNGYNHLSYTSFKIVPLRNYSLLPATVEVLETFHEAILRKPFQLFRRILNDFSSITKAPSFRPFTADFNRGNRKNQLEPGHESMEDASALSHCSLLRNP